jgi:hypothetical protein
MRPEFFAGGTQTHIGDSAYLPPPVGGTGGCRVNPPRCRVTRGVGHSAPLTPSNPKYSIREKTVSMI